MDEKIHDDIKEEEDAAPLEVTIKKEKETPPPDFDYDDYSPGDKEILEIEKEIKEKLERRTNKLGS